MSMMEILMRVRAHAVEYVLVIFVLMSSISVIYNKHNGRSAFVSLQKLEKEHSQLNEEWGRLLLEEGTRAGLGTIEEQALQRLNMIMPTPDMVIVAKP